MAHKYIVLAYVLACVFLCECKNIDYPFEQFEQVKEFLEKIPPEYEEKFPILAGELSPLLPCPDCNGLRRKRSIARTPIDPLKSWLEERIKLNEIARNKCPKDRIRFLGRCIPKSNFVDAPHGRVPRPHRMGEE